MCRFVQQPSCRPALAAHLVRIWMVRVSDFLGGMFGAALAGSPLRKLSRLGGDDVAGVALPLASAAVAIWDPVRLDSYAVDRMKPVALSMVRNPKGIVIVEAVDGQEVAQSFPQRGALLWAVRP